MGTKLIAWGIGVGALCCVVWALCPRKRRQSGPDFRDKVVFWICFAALSLVGVVFVSGGLYLFFIE